MPSIVLTLLFWSAAIAIVVGQVMILRSTARAWAASGIPVPMTEKLFAWLPALALLAVLWFSWKAATAPPTFQFESPTATQPTTPEIRL
jgi:hypothetical protein